MKYKPASQPASNGNSTMIQFNDHHRCLHRYLKELLEVVTGHLLLLLLIWSFLSSPNYEATHIIAFPLPSSDFQQMKEEEKPLLIHEKHNFHVKWLEKSQFLIQNSNFIRFLSEIHTIKSFLQHTKYWYNTNKANIENF